MNGNAGGGATTSVAVVESVTKVFETEGGGVRALDSVSLEIPDHRFTAIMGPSGSGKSTLMHVMAGLDTVTEGRVLLGGVEVTRLDDTERTLFRRERVGFVFQAFNLVPTLDVAANIRLPYELRGRRPTAEQEMWIAELVTMLHLGDRLGHRPYELSGGQQQRVAIARALATRPSAVFADEPTGSLDSRTGREVLGILRSAVDKHGQAIVMVTHDPIAASYADNVIFMADGRVSARYGAMTADEISSLMVGPGTRA